MRIVNGKEFLAIKKPVLYQKCNSDYIWDLPEIKLETLDGADFIYLPLFDIDVFTKDVDPTSTEEVLSLIDRLRKTGQNFSRDYEATSRDGTFVNENDKFVIYDDNDIKALILTLIYNDIIKGENHE